VKRQKDHLSKYVYFSQTATAAYTRQRYILASVGNRNYPGNNKLAWLVNDEIPNEKFSTSV
jgi:hypothetical protein